MRKLLDEAHKKDIVTVYVDLYPISTLGELIEDYAKHYESLSGDKASSLLKQYFAVEEERLQLQQSYVSKFEKAIPPQKVVRYYQIENKLDAIIEYELVEIIPLAK